MECAPCSDGLADEMADPGRNGHREGSPERDPRRRPQDGGPANFRSECSRTARKTNEPAETRYTTRFAGETAATSSGKAAPDEKVAADVSAAWIGRAVVNSEMPSSSRA